MASPRSCSFCAPTHYVVRKLPGKPYTKAINYTVMSSATLLEFILVHLVHRVVYVHANLLVCACVLICRAGSRSASASYVCAVQQIRRTPHSMCAPHMPSLLPPPSLLKARCKLFDFAKQTDVTSQIDISTVEQSGWDATEWSSALRQT